MVLRGPPIRSESFVQVTFTILGEAPMMEKEEDPTLDIHGTRIQKSIGNVDSRLVEVTPLKADTSR